MLGRECPESNSKLLVLFGREIFGQFVQRARVDREFDRIAVGDPLAAREIYFEVTAAFLHSDWRSHALGKRLT